ncbi:MAG: flagellar export chaperone FliS [Sulfurospirillaceae bacterium]|nr:flagellar export chaperone FliS [Sulfurospirillaceae bacterium]MDD3463605.1 flagellar export chaperone FliS [Sulfurospirillaceae bacterium]
MKTNLAYSAYSQNNVSIESSEKLIKMLYEGILRFASQAKRAIELEDCEKKVYWINRASAIFAELINSLNYDGGQIAYYLNGLYIHQIKTLSEANIQNDTKKIDQVLHVTKELLSAWNDEISDEMAE